MVRGHRGRPRKSVEEVESRHARRQREKIISAANRLFREKGYRGASVQDIADKARISKSTIYNHFKDKRFLLYESASRDIHTLIDLAKSVVKSDMPPEKKLKALIFNHIKWRANAFGFAIASVDRNYLPPKLLRSYIGLRDEYEDMFRKVISEIIAQGKSQYLNPKLASLFILGLANSINRWFRPRGELSPDEVAEIACEFILRAMEIQNPALVPDSL